MISFSDVKRYITDSPAVMRFKPWWEIGLDLLLAGLFLLMLLSWTRSFSVESGGLICIPMHGDASTFSSADARYVNSRCYVESSVKTVEFYPYILFIQWMVMFLCQITWIWIPAVVAKFLFFYTIFTEVAGVEPLFIFNPNSFGMLPNIDYSDESREKLKVLHDKITFMLMDDNYISKVYRRKVYALTFFIGCCILWVAAWLFFVQFLQDNFPCILKGGNAEKALPASVCNISPHMFIYGIMLLHILILLLMLSLSAKGLAWHRQLTRGIHRNSGKFFGEDEENYKGLPGYEDLSLLLHLLKANVWDGQFILTTVMYVLTAKYNALRPAAAAAATNHPGLALEPSQRKTKLSYYTFSEEWCIVGLLLGDLSLRIASYTQYPSHLYHILEQLKNTYHGIDLDFSVSIREQISHEMHKSILYLSSLAESRHSRPPSYNSTGQDSLPAYSVCIKLSQMTHMDDWPDHLVLFAAANVLRVRFVIISVNTPTQEDIFSHDVIRPTHFAGPCPSVLLLFLNPHYYYLLENHPDSTPQQLAHHSEFISSRKYRERLRLNAIRKIATAQSFDNKNHPVKRMFVKTPNRSTTGQAKTYVEPDPQNTVVTLSTVDKTGPPDSLRHFTYSSVSKTEEDTTPTPQVRLSYVPTHDATLNFPAPTDPYVRFLIENDDLDDVTYHPTHNSAATITGVSARRSPATGGLPIPP